MRTREPYSIQHSPFNIRNFFIPALCRRESALAARSLAALGINWLVPHRPPLRRRSRRHGHRSRVQRAAGAGDAYPELRGGRDRWRDENGRAAAERFGEVEE